MKIGLLPGDIASCRCRDIGFPFLLPRRFCASNRHRDRRGQPPSNDHYSRNSQKQKDWNCSQGE